MATALPTLSHVAAAILPHLAPSRWDLQRETIVQCLYNLAQESTTTAQHPEPDAFRQAWYDYAQGQGCSLVVTEYHWASCFPTLLGLATLLDMVYVDNPHHYQKWVTESLRQRLQPLCQHHFQDTASNLKVTSSLYEELVTVAAWLSRYSRFPNDTGLTSTPNGGGALVCASLQPPIWYQWRQGRWHLLDQQQSLTHQHPAVMAGATWLAEGIYSLTAAYNAAAIATSSQTDKTRYLAYCKTLVDILPKYREVECQERMLKFMSRAFYDATFLTKADHHANLLGFEDGVYDLDSQSFRPGRPDDYVTLSTGYPFMTTLEESEETEMMTFLSQLWPNEEVRRTVLATLAYHLTGLNREYRIMAVIGDGINGKHSFLRLYELTMGQYLTRLPSHDLDHARLVRLAALAASKDSHPTLHDAATVPIPFGYGPAIAHLSGEPGTSTFSEPVPKAPEIRPGDPGWPLLLPGARSCIYPVGIRNPETTPVLEVIDSKAFYHLWNPPHLMILDYPSISSDNTVTPRFSLETPPKGIPPLENFQWMVIKFHSVFSDHPTVSDSGDLASGQRFPRIHYLSDKCLRWRISFMRLLLNLYQKLRSNPRLEHFYLPPSIVNLNHYWHRCIVAARRHNAHS